MSDPYLGEVRMFGGNFAPSGWAFCDGRTLAIAENDALFALIGTTYGGDGQTTFNLPDLRGRLPVNQGTGPSGDTYIAGQQAGEEQVTLETANLPAHTHALLAGAEAADRANPKGHVPARSNTINAYITGAPNVALSSESITSTGGSQPHENVQPYQCISFIIALTGVYPTQN